MPDDLTPAQRSYAMSRVRGRNNRSTERAFVSLVWRAGIRGWRRHAPIAGRPDVVFPQLRIAVFLDGCFWHQCPECFRWPATNAEYWRGKIGGNRRRDRRVTAALRSEGWTVLRLWEHELREPRLVERRLRRSITRRERLLMVEVESRGPSTSTCRVAGVHRSRVRD